MRVRGAGWLGGAGLRGLVHNEVWRAGYGFYVFGAPGLSLSHAPLGPDLSLSLGTPWGAGVDAYAGRFFHFGPIAAYADLRVGGTFAKVDVDVRSAMLGEVQTMTRKLATPLVAPRIGAMIPLGRGLSFDISGSATPFGMERASLFAGISFMPPGQDDAAKRNSPASGTRR
jgi:hypothetical protein